MTLKKKQEDPFKALTWADLQEWAGSKVVSKGRSYHRQGTVQDLARTPTGGLIAFVRGSRRYVTRVEFQEGELSCLCSCPYPGNCKHAVAVALEYLERVKTSTDVPAITERDPRMGLLPAQPSEEDGRDEVLEDENDLELVESEAAGTRSKRERRSKTPPLRSFLEGQTKEQLLALIEELAERYPEVRDGLQDRRDLSGGSVSRLIEAVRREICALSEEPAWRNSWNGEGYIPDYSRVKERLAGLLERGHADAVLELGKELLESGIRLVEMSHDEGETASEIASCLTVVFDALPKSSLDAAHQLLWAIDATLADEYDMCPRAEAFWKQKRSAADWGVVADMLLERLNRLPSEEGDDTNSRNYRRDRLTDWILHALDNAGRKAQAMAICEREAVKTGSYKRLVERLLEAGRLNEADAWIHKGIAATQRRWPGIADSLRKHWRTLREKEGDWLRVAALEAEEFFDRPTHTGFQALRKAATQAEVWPAVSAAAMRFLETGKRPEKGAGWPIPETGLPILKERGKNDFPDFAVLIEIAITDKKPDEMLRWYDKARETRRHRSWYGLDDNKIAHAVAEKFPARAIEIWKRLAEDQIARAQPKAYSEAARHLANVQRVMKRTGREGEWQEYMGGLRVEHQRKRKFLEVLDGLSGKRIVES